MRGTLAKCHMLNAHEYVLLGKELYSTRQL